MPAGDDDKSTRNAANWPQAIVNLFNKYFPSIFTQSTQRHNNSFDSNLKSILSDVELKLKQVEAVLRNLDDSNETAADGIPVRLLYEAASVIAPSLCLLFNKSLALKDISHERKKANVIPIFKKQKKEYIENYRRISLSAVSKVLKRCISNNIKVNIYQEV